MEQIFQWEVRTWSRAYPLWHEALEAVHGTDRKALALGERDGGLSLMLAQHGFATVCSDLRGPTEHARSMHATHGLQGMIAYEGIDTLAIPKPDGQFDVVAFKSMIGALGSKERQAKALDEMHRVLKPGGTLLFAENLSGTALHRWLRKRFVAWDHYWRYLHAAGDMDLFHQFEGMRMRTTGFLANLGRSEAQRDVIARFDALVLPLVPSTWRTVLFGVAKKRKA